MTTVYLIRHGEYENPEYVFPGRLPGFPLSERGREQVFQLAKLFQGTTFAALYSSPLLRTRQTAEILSEVLHIPALSDDRLLEVRTMAEGIPMKLFDDTSGELSYTPPYQEKGAESMAALSQRTVGFIEEKREEHEGKQVLVIGHGDPIRFGVMHYMGLPISFPASREVGIPLAGGYRIEFGTATKPQVSSLVVK